MNVPAWLLPHTVTIRARTGAGAHGESFADPFTVAAMVQAQTRLVRSPQGEQATSSTTVFLPPGTTCPDGSLVDIGTRTGVAVQITTADGGGLPTPDHLGRPV